MATAHRQPGFREQRRVTCEILSASPTGILRLYVEGACLDVIQAKDISPFGVGIQINAAIDDDAPVKLSYVTDRVRLEVSGTVMWRKVVRKPSGDRSIKECWVGIFLHPRNLDSNVAFYQAMIGLSRRPTRTR